MVSALFSRRIPVAKFSSTLGYKIPETFGRLPNLSEKLNPTTIFQNFRDFFDISTFPGVKTSPYPLEWIDALYAEVLPWGFPRDVGLSRLKSLKSHCAFNIFVKTNAIINHIALKSMDEKLKDLVKSDLFQRFSIPDNMIEMVMKKQYVKTRAEFFSYIETLRAFVSQHVFAFLASVLRYSNIRDCGKPETLFKRVSILAVLGLMLEQMLDFADHLKGLNPEILSERRRITTDIGRVLLGHLQELSVLAFPSNPPLARCFGKDKSAILGIFFKDQFWHELFKESSKSIPPHILFLADEGDQEACHGGDDICCADTAQGPAQPVQLSLEMNG
jgi:hypothetical protein